MKYKINFNLKILLIFMFLFLMCPLSVYAGKTDFEQTDKTNKDIKDLDTDKESIKKRLNEYCSFWSSDTFGNGEYSKLGNFDENSVNGYAVMVDTIAGGRGGSTASREGAECVEEYQGYYYYDVKVTVVGESEVKNGYTRRTYYKYVELKKDERAFSSSTYYVVNNASTGIWLYFSNDSISDANRSIQEELGMIDVFTGESMSIESRPYWEEMFMWPISSKGVGVARDTDDIVNAICQHDGTDYSIISKSDAFWLTYFQRRNTRRSTYYLTNNESKYDVHFEIPISNYSTVIAGIYARTGHKEYYEYPSGAWYYSTSGNMGLKNWIKSAFGRYKVRLDERWTYTDHNGKQWPKYFVLNPGDGLRYTCSTAYSPILEEMGSQYYDFQQGIDSDMMSSAPFASYDTKRNPYTHTNITKGWVNAVWNEATNNNTDKGAAPREILRTLQAFLKSHTGAFNKFVGYVNKESGDKYYGTCNASNLSLTNYNIAVASGNSQLALDMLITLYSNGMYYTEWYDYASDGLATRIGVSTPRGTYNHYASGILIGKTSNVADDLMLGDGNTLIIVDLFKAFGISDSKAYDFIEAYRKNPYSKTLTISGINSEKVKMLVSALNGTDSTTIVLTNDEINKGKVDMTNSQTELYTGYIPYVAVLNKTNVTGYKSYGSEDSEIYVPPYDGTNASSIVDTFYNFALNNTGAFSMIGKSNGAPLFENIFTDETQYSNMKATFLFVFGKESITGTSEKIMSYQEFEDYNHGANIGTMADSVRSTVFSRSYGILSSDNQNGSYAETITVKSTMKAEDIMKYCTSDGYMKDSIIRNQDSVKFFATFYIDAYKAELKKGLLYHNQRESLDYYGGPLSIMPSSIYKTNVEGATKNHTKSVSIFAANTSVYHSQDYILGEDLSLNISKGNLGKFSSLFDVLVNGTFVDDLGHTRSIYGDFVSNAEKLCIEIADSPVANFGYTRDDNGIVTLYLTADELDDLNTNMIAYTRTCINSGYLKGLTIDEFNKIAEYVANRNTHALLVNWLSIVFDRNSVCAAFGYVPETPEDLIVSDGTNNLDKTNSNGSSNSECRETIDWFKDKSYTYFNPTANWVKKGTTAIDNKITTITALKNDLTPKNIYDKLALFPKNYELTNPVDSTKISGKVTVGRIPEARLKGLKIGDFKLIMFEEFFVNDEEWGTRAESFNSIGKVLSNWYGQSNPHNYTKIAMNLFSDVYATDVLFRKWNTSAGSGLLSNMTLKAVSYQAPVGEIKVLRNECISDLKLGSAVTTNIENTEWTPGMVVNYEYTYSLPYGSEKTTVQYISNKAGSQYNNNYVNNNNYTGLTIINDALVRFALVPKTNSNGYIVNNSNQTTTGTLGFNKNNYNDETVVYADIPDGGNMSWIDDESIYVKLTTGTGKTWEQVITYVDEGYSRTINIPEDVFSTLECLDDSGRLTTNLTVSIQPILKYDNYVYGRYANSFHTVSKMEVNIDNRITSSQSKIPLSSVKLVNQYSNLDPEIDSSYLENNNSKKDGSSYLSANSKLGSTFVAQLDIQFTFAQGTAPVGAEHVNEVVITVPGTEVSGCSSSNNSRCKSDNTISEDWEHISVVFKGSNPHDNAVQDIIIYDNEDPESSDLDILGTDNYGKEAGTQSLVSSNSEKWLTSDLGIIAIVERLDNNGISSLPECSAKYVETVQVGHFELSYTANGVDYSQSTACIVSTEGIDWATHKSVDILTKQGDKLIFMHSISTVYPISELTVKFNYRLCTHETLSYDNEDSNMENNTRSESWDSGIDVTVEVTSVPNKIIKQGQYACKLDENGNVVSGAETITGTLETFSFEAKATISAILSTSAAKDVINDLDMKYTLFVYAEQNGKKFYPVSVSGEGITGTYYNGKAHMLLSRLGEYDVVAEWEDVQLGEGQVKVQFEVWPVPSLDSSYKTIYENFPEIPTSLYYKDVFDQNYPSVNETDPYKSGTTSSNNKNSKSFNVSATYKNCDFACSSNDDFLANEVRWTVRFKWTNYQNGIADWTSIKNSDEWYKYSASLTNINYEFNEQLDAYHGEIKIRSYNWAGFSTRYSSSWMVKKYKTKLNKGFSLLEGETDLVIYVKCSHCGRLNAVGYNTKKFYCYYEKCEKQTTIPSSAKYYRGVDLTLSKDQIYYTREEITNVKKTQLIKINLFGKQYKVNWYTGTATEYQGYRTITGIRYYDVNTCKHEKGPDHNEYNWGPNGLTGTSTSADYSKYVNGYYLPDETGARTGSVKAVSKYNSTTIPTKYWNYIYNGGTIAGTDTAPKTTNNDSTHNWDTLSSTSYYDSNYAGGLKYHFYSEKVTASVQVASSRDNYVWHNPNNWTVYNGESFKIRGKIVYEINTYGNYPRSPVQDYEVDSYYTSKLFTKYYNKNKGGYDTNGFYIYTEKVANGKVEKGTSQKIYIAVFDSKYKGVVNGVGNYTKAWKRTGNTAWSPNAKNVDYYNGAMKSLYAGQKVSGAYEVKDKAAWKNIDAKYNLFKFLKERYGLTNYVSRGVSQECNYISTTYLAGKKPTIYAEYKITGTSAFNKFVVRLPDSKTSTNNKTTAYWNILPGYNSSLDAITVPITNVAQDIKIQFNAFPFKGASSSYSYHPYLGANDDQHDDRYLCDVSTYTIKIRPTGNIIGDVTTDDDTNVSGDGGWKDGETSGGAGIY